MGRKYNKMDAERLVKISRDNIPAVRRFPGRPKRRWSDLIPNLKRRNRLQQRRKRGLERREEIQRST